MADSHIEPADHRPGDKIRIRAGPRAGHRGRIRAVSSSEIEVELDDGTSSSVQPSEITNYSLAARKAWQVMPKRAGRPPLDESQRKKLVSIRVDREAWRQLGEAVDRGLISSREEAINSWIRHQLHEMLVESPRRSSQSDQQP